jgi:hypothetical protein
MQLEHAVTRTVEGRIAVRDDGTGKMLHDFEQYAKREVTVQDNQIVVYRTDNGTTTVIPLNGQPVRVERY